MFDAARLRPAARLLCRASKDPRRYLMPLAGGKRRGFYAARLKTRGVSRPTEEERMEEGSLLRELSP